MAMKKKFLGLAMAAMVAMPMTTAFAAGQKDTVIFEDSKPYYHTVPVSGNIDKGNGTAATGQIKVELPTSMAFSVDKAGNFQGCNFDVDNKSESPIAVYVSEFNTVQGGITIKSKSEFSQSSLKSSLNRSNVYLELKGTESESVDLYDFLDKKITEKKVLSVEENNMRTITLTGGAGTASDSDSGNLDTTGASGKFSLVFKIQKQ